MHLRLALLALALIMACPVGAFERTLNLDPEDATISFTLGATLHSVHGSFALARGEIRFAEIPGPASGEIVLNATSAETGNAKRDRKMHREVLESANHSDIVLIPTRVGGTLPSSGEGALTLHGRLRVHGGEHEVVLPARVSVSGSEVQVSASLQVPYVEWGMEDPSAFVLRVDKHVDVAIEVRGRLSEALQP